jgi:hypothetical protein
MHKDAVFADAFARACQHAGRLRAAGWDETDIHEALRRDNIDAGLPLTMRRIERIARWIATKPAGRSTPSRQAPDPTFVRWIRDARDQAAMLLSHGRFGRSCHAVFLALLTIMEKTGNLTVTASCRELAEVTGYVYKTVSRAVQALTHANSKGIPVLLRVYIPLRRVLSHPNGRRLFLPANSYTLRHSGATEKGAKKTHTKNTPRGGVDCVSVAPFLPDTFRGKRGLPRTRFAALQAIEHGGVRTARDLVEACGVCLRTARAALQDLMRVGLIAKSEGTYRRTDESLAAAAERLGSTGTADRRRAEHEWEREKLVDRLLKRGGRLRTRPKPPPAPVWEGIDATNEQPFKQAASFKPRKKQR